MLHLLHCLPLAGHFSFRACSNNSSDNPLTCMPWYHIMLTSVSLSPSVMNLLSAFMTIRVMFLYHCMDWCCVVFCFSYSCTYLHLCVIRMLFSNVKSFPILINISRTFGDETPTTSLSPIFTSVSLNVFNIFKRNCVTKSFNVNVQYLIVEL